MKTMRDNTVVGYDNDVLTSNVYYKDTGKEIKRFGVIDMTEGKEGYATPIGDDDEDQSYEYEGIIGGTGTNESPSWEDLVNVASEVFVADRTSGDIFEVEDGMQTNELSSDIASAVEEMNDD